MMNITDLRRCLRIAGVTCIVFVATACESFLEVENPNNLEADRIDPEADANLLGWSVYQAWISDISELSVQTAWFTGSAWVGDTFPTRNDYGRRDIPNTTDDGNHWSDAGDNIYFARTTAYTLEEAGPSLDLARAYFVSGETIRTMAETFCVGTIADFTVTPPQSRGPMPTGMLLDSAIADLSMVRTVAQGVTGPDAEEAQALSMAAQVHIARAHLQAGRAAEASAAAAQVPADFHFELWHLDDSSNRALGNRVWNYSESRISLVVPPVFRAMADAGDPRIEYVDEGRPAQDGVLNFFRQDKIKGWGAPDRWASGLEARYIQVEADQNAAAMLDFINERRAFGNQDPFPATTDMGLLMTELLEQKTRDFWLESSTRMADFRRVPQYMSYIIPAGEDTYYKPDLGIVAGDTCWPVPQGECDSNDEFGGTEWCTG